MRKLISREGDTPNFQLETLKILKKSSVSFIPKRKYSERLESILEVKSFS